MNCAISMELFEICLDTLGIFWTSNTGLQQCYYFSNIVEVVRCTWTSVHDVSFITGCQCSQRCLTEKMHIFSGCFVECTA